MPPPLNIIVVGCGKRVYKNNIIKIFICIIFITFVVMNDKIKKETESVRVSKDKLIILRTYSDMGSLTQLMDEAIDDKLVKLKKMREFKDGLKG